MSREAKPLGDPYFLLARSSPILMFRGLMMAMQAFGKRQIVAQHDLLPTYTDIAAVENLIFIILFSGLHIISSKVSALHALEKNSPDFDRSRIGVVYRQGIGLGLSLMFPVSLLCLGASPILRWTNQSESAIAFAPTYFLYGFPAYFFDMLYRSRARVDIGRSEPHYPLIADTIECALDVSLTYALINGLFYFPKMGLFAAPIAYCIASLAVASGYAIFSLCRKELSAHQLYHFSQDSLSSELQDTSEFKNVLKDGWNLSVRSSIIYITQTVLTILCGLSGDAALEGVGVAGVYSYLMSMLLSGFSDAGSVIVGRLHKSQPDAAKKLGYFCISAGFMFSVMTGLFVFLKTDSIADIFIDSQKNPNGYAAVKDFLKVQAVLECFNAIATTSSDMLMGWDETHYPLRLNFIFTFFLNTSLSLIAALLLEMNATAVYATQLIGSLFSALLLAERWHFHPNPENSPTSRLLSKFTFLKSEALREPEIVLQSSSALQIASDK